VHGRGMKMASRQRGADAGVHPATKQDHGARFFLFHHIDYHRVTEKIKN
jgi:hypothetical protein